MSKTKADLINEAFDAEDLIDEDTLCTILVKKPMTDEDEDNIVDLLDQNGIQASVGETTDDETTVFVPADHADSAVEILNNAKIECELIKVDTDQ